MRPVPQRAEFIALMACLFAVLAFSIDAMLPALPVIAAELSPNSVNSAQLVVTSFIFGMGAGTLIAGPLSDAFGRRPIIFAGIALYILAALGAWQSGSLTGLLIARFVQGLGSSGPRVVGLAIIRDIHGGRDMARIMSFVMMVFTIVPALAPMIGAGIMGFGGWRSIFVGFVIAAMLTATWFALRMPETHSIERRTDFNPSALWASCKEVLSYPVLRGSILVQTLIFAVLFGTVANIQPIFDIAFGRAESFPYWFGGIAAISATGSYINAKLVVLLGMRYICRMVLSAQVVIALTALAVNLSSLPVDVKFAMHVFWTLSLFMTIGFTTGNMNAIAMEPVGHIAGMAASIVAAVSTVGAVVLSIPLSLMFDGSPIPLAVYVSILAALATALLYLPSMAAPVEQK